MLNNRGQSLVLFILIIPILLGIMALVIDVGNALIKKNEIENAIEFVIDYGLENEMNETEALIMLLNYNLGDCENTLKIDDDKIINASVSFISFSNP